VIPSVEYAADVDELTGAKNRPDVGLTVTVNHCPLVGRLADAHVIPSVEDAATVELSVTTTYLVAVVVLAVVACT
jgi:hypothetical protein